MEQDTTRGVHISMGDGIVAHVENLTAFATGDEDQLNELLVRLNALAGEPWTEIVRSLTSGISEAGFDDHPALACVSVADDKVAALVFGETSLSVTIDGSKTVLDGRDSSTWIDVALRGNVDRVHCGEQSESAVVGVLRDGVIPAGGFLLDTSGPIPAAERWSEVVTAETTAAQAPAEPEHVENSTTEAAAPESTTESTPESTPAPVAETPVPETAPAEAPTTPENAPAFGKVSEAPSTANNGTQRSMFARIEEIERVSRDVLDGSDTSSSSAPASPFPQSANEDATDEPTIGASGRPQIKGVTCPEGHLTSPTESTCRTCGVSVSVDAPSAKGDRPTLGTLTFDDGAVLNVDRPAVIGADVPTGYIVDGEPATLVRLDDGVGGVSPVHIEVRLSGWNVEMVDMNSETGTFTMLGGERQTRTKLRANQAVLLQRDMEVQAGGRSFVYTIDQTAEV